MLKKGPKIKSNHQGDFDTHWEEGANKKAAKSLRGR